MSKPSDNPADPFKKALAEATKTLAHDPELSVSFTVDPSGISGEQMRLPQVSRRMSREEVLLARGTADALAFNRRYHSADTHARYAPTEGMARELYQAMETARCEAPPRGGLGGVPPKIGQKWPILACRPPGRQLSTEHGSRSIVPSRKFDFSTPSKGVEFSGKNPKIPPQAPPGLTPLNIYSL